jgi:hypothetical protein
MKLLVCIRDNLQLVPHFLQHYQNLGVDEFWIGVHEPRNVFPELIPMLEGVTCRISCIENPRFGDQVDADFMNACRAELPPNEWIVIADLDEFIKIEGVGNLPAYLGHRVDDSLWGEIRDRIARGGIIPETIHPPDEYPIDQQFPWACNLTQTLVGGVHTKRSLARAKVPIIAGHHAGNAIFPQADQPHPGMWINHYRWCGRFQQNLSTRCMNRPASKEYRNAWNYMVAHNWKIDLDNLPEGSTLTWIGKCQK